MRFALLGFASCVLAGALLHCSLLVDADGLSGGAGGDATSLIEAGDGGPLADADAGADATVDGSSPGSLGPLWLAYGNATGAVGVRQWQVEKGTWSPELPGPSVDGALVRWVVPKETPLGSFVGIVSTATGGSRLDVFERDATGAWKLGFTQPMAESTRRAFDIEYESKANGVVVVYGDATAHPKARRRTNAGWSGETEIMVAETIRPVWVELARNPLTNEIALVSADGGLNLSVTLWDGAAWGASRELDGYLNTLDFKCFDATYENGSGNLFVGWGHQSPVDGGGTIRQMQYVTRPLGGTFTDPTVTADFTPPGSMAMAAEVGTNRIAISFVEYFCNPNDLPCDDFKTLIWDGSKFSSQGDIDDDTTTLYLSRPSTQVTGIAWRGTTGEVIAAYHRNLGDGTRLAQTRFSGGNWTTRDGANAPPALPPRASMQLVSAPTAMVVAVVEDTTGGLWSKAYGVAPGMTAGTWTDVGGGAPLATSLLTSNGVPFGVTTP